MSALGTGSVHIEGPNPRLRMPRCSPACHRALGQQPQPAPPPPTCRCPHPSAGCWPQDLPAAPSAPAPATLLRVSVTAQAPEIAPRLGQQLTHWRTLMKPSGSSSRRQRSPANSWSTCEDREVQGSGHGGPRESAGPPSPTHAQEREKDKGPSTQVEGGGESPGGTRSTCWRGDLSAGRLAAVSVEDMLARRGPGAARGLGSLAQRLRGPRSGRGPLTSGGRERWRSASSPRGPGIQAGGVGRRRSPRSRPLRCPSGCRKPPRPIQTPVKLASELGRPVTWRAREPSSRPLRPFCSPQGSLKGPVASTGSLAERGSRSLPEAQRRTRGRTPRPLQPTTHVGN